MELTGVCAAGMFGFMVAGGVGAFLGVLLGLWIWQERAK